MKTTTIGIVPRTEFVGSNYKVQLNYNYLIPFIERGISTIIIPLKDANLQLLLHECDGFLIPGGDDIDPKYYNEENLGQSKHIDASVDELDEIVIKHALRNKKPILGICRGLQSLAVFCGGSLYQDINEAGLLHEEHEHSHLVTNLKTNEFGQKLKDLFVINSYHHQCVKEIPEGFVPLFKHNDIIEGIMHKELPIIGVQWHPERIFTAESKYIFDYFCDEVKKYHNERE